MFFFFNDPATTEIYTLSLHDALPISKPRGILMEVSALQQMLSRFRQLQEDLQRQVNSVTVEDRKSTRLNSSHTVISYAVFCLKKKKKKKNKNKIIRKKSQRKTTNTQ